LHCNNICWSDTMKKLIVSILSQLTLASSALAASTGAMPSGLATTPAMSAACDPASLRPDQFEVAIDRATGISFVHTPCGWSYMGVVKRDAIDEGIALANATPVPAKVLAAEITLRPWLASFRPQPVARNGGN
jgi:hypothetical protein